jgi:transposase
MRKSIRYEIVHCPVHINGTQVLRDAGWAVWAPLIEAVRPRGKTPPQELRRTISAIFWRHRNGAKWRSIPAEPGPWWLAAQLFIRWAKQGVWERLLDLVQQHDIALGIPSSTAPISGLTTRRRARKKGARQPTARGAWPLSRRLWHESLRDRRRAIAFARPRAGA